MAHPFISLFEKELRKSTLEHNHLLTRVDEICNRGYRKEEVVGVLETMCRGRLDDGEVGIIEEVLQRMRSEEETF